MGSKEHRLNADSLMLRCAVLTCSDTRTAETDTSGAYILKALEENGHETAAYQIVSDEAERIRALVDGFADEGLDVVLINGGTGIARRDTTFDAVSDMLEKTMPGFGEIFRVLSYEDVGSAAMLSRATAGVYRNMLVFSMPGSTGAVRLAVDRLILPDLKHLVWEIRR